MSIILFLTTRLFVSSSSVVCTDRCQLGASALRASLHCIAQIPPFFPTRPCFQHGCRKISPHIAVFVAEEHM